MIGYKEAFIEESEQTLCIVMEYAQDGDVYQKIVDHQKTKTHFEEDDIWRIFIGMTRGLKALHRLRI